MNKTDPTSPSGNSLKFTESGSITIQVYDLPVAALRNEAASGVRMIGIAVRDTGMGMTPECVLLATSTLYPMLTHMSRCSFIR